MGQVFTIFSTITGKGLKSDMQLYDRMITKQIIPFNATKFCGFKRDMFRPTCVIFMLNDVKKLKGCVFFRATAPPVGQGPLVHYVFRSHTTTRHSLFDWTGRVISPSQRQHTILTTNIHATDGIRTLNLSCRAAADLRLRPRGHWDRLKGSVLCFALNTKILNFKDSLLVKFLLSISCLW